MINKLITISIAAAFLAQPTSAVSVADINSDFDLDATQFGQIGQIRLPSDRIPQFDRYPACIRGADKKREDQKEYCKSLNPPHKIMTCLFYADWAFS